MFVNEKFVFRIIVINLYVLRPHAPGRRLGTLEVTHIALKMNVYSILNRRLRGS